MSLLIYHVDLKRAMWRLDGLTGFLTRLQGWGFNAVLLEIEDKFRFANHPALVHPDAPSHDEWSVEQEVLARCGCHLEYLGSLERTRRMPRLGK